MEGLQPHGPDGVCHQKTVRHSMILNMNYPKRESTPTRAQQLQKTLLESIKNAKEKLMRFQHLQTQARSAEKAAERRQPLYPSPKKSYENAPSFPSSPQKQQQHLQRSSIQYTPVPKPYQSPKPPQRAIKTQNEKIESQERPSEAMIKAISCLKKKVAQLENQNCLIPKLKQELQHSLNRQNDMADQLQNLQLQSQQSHHQKQKVSLQLENQKARASELSESLFKLNSQHVQLQLQLQASRQRAQHFIQKLSSQPLPQPKLDACTQTLTVKPNRNQEVQCQIPDQKQSVQANEVKVLRRTQGELLAQIEGYDKKLKKVNKAFAASEQAKRSAELKLTNYRSTFCEINSKFSKSPASAVSVLRLALGRISRMDEDFEARMPKNEKSNSVSRSLSRSRDRSSKKLRTEMITPSNPNNSRSRDWLLKTERSELSGSRSRSSSHSSFTNTKLKRKLSNKRRLIIDDLKGQQSSLLQNEIIRLESDIQHIRKETQKCHSQLARASVADQQRLRVQLNELTLQIGDKMQDLRTLKKQNRQK